MITGANTNVRHRGVVFHVQTEDSGRTNPHVISHLYHHGTILASQKTEYAEQLDADDLVRVVRALIESQHQAMLTSLTDGAYDAVIDERLGGTDVALEPRGDATGAEPLTDGLEAPTPMPELELRRSPHPVLPPRPVRAFGEGIVSQKPLDEVILDYLAEKARGRAAERVGKAQKSPNG